MSEETNNIKLKVYRTNYNKEESPNSVSIINYVESS